MSYTKPPPLRISDRLRDMDPQTDILLRDANLQSIRSLISRIKRGKRRMRYACAVDIGGIRVWRLS